MSPGALAVAAEMHLLSPGLLNEFGTTLLVFGVAIAAALAIHAVAGPKTTWPTCFASAANLLRRRPLRKARRVSRYHQGIVPWEDEP